jgi:hypothetical protein
MSLVDNRTNCLKAYAYILTTSPSFKVVAASGSLAMGEKWATQSLMEIQVGKPTPLEKEDQSLGAWSVKRLWVETNCYLPLGVLALL